MLSRLYRVALDKIAFHTTFISSNGLQSTKLLYFRSFQKTKVNEMAVMLKDESLEVKIDKDKSGQKKIERRGQNLSMFNCLKQMMGQSRTKLA